MRNYHENNYLKNSTKIKAKTNAYKKQNPDKRKVWKANRRAAEIKRMPTYADKEAIALIYKNCPKGMVVDHIIPLQGDGISGFHIAKNLQYLTPAENYKKNNKFPYYPMEFYEEKGLLPLPYVL